MWGQPRIPGISLHSVGPSHYDRGLKLKPINLEADSAACLRFRQDAYECSFGNADQFFDHDGLGPQHYLKVLREMLARFPSGCLHLWRNDAIVGQIESAPLKQHPEIGYVNLYYLTPEFRGKGFAATLDAHVTEVFRKLNCEKIQLSVSPSNLRAQKFYEKCGWKEVERRDLVLMEKRLR